MKLFANVKGTKREKKKQTTSVMEKDDKLNWS